jgi:putative ATPase
VEQNTSDALLGCFEAGYILLIGSATENPAFSLTRALVSRVSLFEFKKIGVDDIKKTLLRAIDAQAGLKNFNIRIDVDSLTYFATACDGDVRSALNGLEIGALTTSLNAVG